MIARASGAPPLTQQLNYELHRLHARASEPSVKIIATSCSLGAGTVHRLFSSPTLPKCKHLLSVVEYLAKQCRNTDPDAECDRFDALWQRALDAEWLPNPYPRPAGESDDDPYDGPCPAGPVDGPTTPAGPSGANEEPIEPDVAITAEGSRRLSANVGAEVIDPRTSRALILDVSNGDDATARDLSGLHGHFLQERGWKADYVVGATYRQFWRSLTTAASGTTGALLVYLSGHVLQAEGRNGDDYLVTADTQRSDEGWIDNAVSLRAVRQLLLRSAARQLILVVDGCFAGSSRLQYQAYDRVIPDPVPPSALLAADAPDFDEFMRRPTVVVGYRRTVRDGGSGALAGPLLDVLGKDVDDDAGSTTLEALFGRVRSALAGDGVGGLTLATINGGGGLALNPRPAISFTKAGDAETKALRPLHWSGLDRDPFSADKGCSGNVDETQPDVAIRMASDAARWRGSESLGGELNMQARTLSVDDTEELMDQRSAAFAVPMEAEVVRNLRMLARQGQLAAAFRAATPAERRQLFNAAFEVAWPIVFKRLARPSGQQLGLASGSHPVNPLADGGLDRFYDDVEAVAGDLLAAATMEIHDAEQWISARLHTLGIEQSWGRRGASVAAQSRRLPAWLAAQLRQDQWLAVLAVEILAWVGVPSAAGAPRWPLDTWAARRCAVAGDRVGTDVNQVQRDVDQVLAVMRTRQEWYADYVERPLADKAAPEASAGPDRGATAPTQLRQQSGPGAAAD